MAVGSMELDTMIHEQLALRSRKRREELQRKASRYSHAQEIEDSRIGDEKRIGILDELKAITSRRGFLTSRLQLDTLTPLQRWHAQLQLLKMDNQTGDDPASVSADNAEDASVQDGQSALEKALRDVNNDQLCFDIEYVTSIRVADLKETLFDANQQQLRASEALVFSSTRDGYTMRVVLFTLESSPELHARSSLFIQDLEARVRSVADQDAKELIECLWAVNTP